MWFPFLTANDLPAALVAAFDDVDGEIRRASYRVRAELRTARFETDQDGNPTDANVSAAIMDATKAQLAFWAETGDASGAAAQNGGGSILSVSLPGGAGTTDVNRKQDAREAPAVTEILRTCPGIDWAVSYS